MKEKNDELFELLLQEAVSDNLEKQIKEIETDISEHEFSKEHKKKVKKIFKTPFYKTSSFRKTFKNVAMIFISVCIIFALIMSISPKARAFVKKIFYSWTDTVAVFSSNPENTNNETVKITEEKNIKWEPSFLPDGYTIELEEHSNIGFVMYSNGTESIIFEYAKDDSASFVNNEDIVFDTLIQKGVTYYLFVADKNSSKENVIVWQKDGYRFSLNSFVEIEALKNMAFSVNKK